jgi:hypothetical protein
VGDLHQELVWVVRLHPIANARRPTAAAPVRSFASLAAENEAQITTNQARQDAIDDDPRNPPPEGDGIVNARTEMKLDYAPGRNDLTMSDFVFALTSPTGILLCGVSQRIHFIRR